MHKQLIDDFISQLPKPPAQPSVIDYMTEEQISEYNSLRAANSVKIQFAINSILLNPLNTIVREENLRTLSVLSELSRGYK